MEADERMIGAATLVRPFVVRLQVRVEATAPNGDPIVGDYDEEVSIFDAERQWNLDGELHEIGDSVPVLRSESKPPPAKVLVRNQA